MTTMRGLRLASSSDPGWGPAPAGPDPRPALTGHEAPEFCPGLPEGYPSWYVVQTKPRSENKALWFLSQKGITTFLPRLLAQRHGRSGRRQALDPLFPGYLFTRFVLEPESLDRIRWTPGVRRLLGDGEEGTPIPVPDDVVWYLQERTGRNGHIIQGSAFGPGMRVRFKGGPLAHLEGIIERPTSRTERVRVLLDLMNARVTVEVSIDELVRA